MRKSITHNRWHGDVADPGNALRPLLGARCWASNREQDLSVTSQNQPNPRHPTDGAQNTGVRERNMSRPERVNDGH
jgi:hypothetical protein